MRGTAGIFPLSFDINLNRFHAFPVTRIRQNRTYRNAVFLNRIRGNFDIRISKVRIGQSITKGTQPDKRSEALTGKKALAATVTAKKEIVL